MFGTEDNYFVFYWKVDIWRFIMLIYHSDYHYNHNYIKILKSDWSSAGLISAVIVQLHTSCACNWTVVRVMPE